MNKFNLVIALICASLCIELAVFAQPRGMKLPGESEEKAEPTPVETPVTPVTTPATPVETEPTPDAYRPFPKGTPITTETITPTNPSPDVDVPTKTTTTTTTTTTTPSSGSGVSYGNQLNRNNDGVGGASNDIEAPTALEDKKFIKEPLVPDGVYEKKRLKERQVLRYDDIREADVLWSKRLSPIQSNLLLVFC